MTELLNVTPEQRAAIVTPAAAALSVAQGFKILSDDGYEVAADRLKLVKGAMKDLEAKKKTVMDPLNEAVRAARALFAEPEANLARAEGLYKGAILTYQQEQERKRAEEQARLDEIARKERERVEKDAAAARARAEEQRRKEEEARRAGDATEAARLAKLAEANEVKAERKDEVAQAVVPGIVQREAPKVGGISTRETWSALVIDAKALVQAIAAGTVPMTAFEPNMKFLNNQAKALKKELSYPGVRAVVEKGIAAGSK